MSDYIISCCSTADISEKHFLERDIHYICFHYELDGVAYIDDLGKTMDIEDFYKAMTEGADTKTSQINADEYEKYFEDFLKQGKDILHITLSSGISGTINSAQIAAQTLMEKYPDRKIYVIDSLAASSGYGLLMDKVADLRDAGMGIDELRGWVEENKLRVNHWFFTTDLTFFIKGGRVSKVSGFVGNLLNLGVLLFLKDCKETIKEFGSYIWDEKAVERGDDKPVKQHDHCMDAARYFAYTIIRRERKWS
jgi:DegV family protein with EDD domain